LFLLEFSNHGKAVTVAGEKEEKRPTNLLRRDAGWMDKFSKSKT
jgi:hypothetical protein